MFGEVSPNPWPVISDVWLSNLLAGLTRRASASDVSKRLDLAVRLLIGDDKT